LVQKDGKWERRPGLLAARLITVPRGLLDEEIDGLMNKHGTALGELDLPPGEDRRLQSRLAAVRHKLHAANYHLRNYRSAEEQKTSDFKTSHSPPAGVEIAQQDPRLVYEVEAFLFQARSCLDMLARVVAHVMRFSGDSFGSQGDDLVKQLENNAPTRVQSVSTALVALIRHVQQSWVDELVRMRDQITHRSALERFECFLEEPYRGGQTARIHYPTMPDGQRALHFCERIERELKAFADEFLGLTLEAQRLVTKTESA